MAQLDTILVKTVEKIAGLTVSDITSNSALAPIAYAGIQRMRSFMQMQGVPKSVYGVHARGIHTGSSAVYNCEELKREYDVFSVWFGAYRHWPEDLRQA